MRDDDSVRNGPDRTPDVLLERYLLDELPADQKRRLETRLAHDVILKGRLEALRVSTENFAQTHDAGVLAHGVRTRLRREAVEAELRGANTTTARRGTEVTGLGWAAGLAGWKQAVGGAFLLALAAIPAWRVLDGTSSGLVTESRNDATGIESGLDKEAENKAEDGASVATTPDESVASKTPGTGTSSEPTMRSSETATSKTASQPSKPATVIASVEENPMSDPPEARHDTRLKGVGPALALFRRTPAGAEPLKPGASVKPGDVIRIGYRAGGRAFGAIFSVDGNGNVTRHWPSAGDRAAPLERGEALLPEAFELDAAPDYERFFLVSGERTFDLKPVLESLHAGKTPGLPGVAVARFDLIKDNGL